MIDVLTTAYVSHLVPNQQHGTLVVDEIPGLRTALLEPATTVDLTAVLTDGRAVRMTLDLPGLAAALILKALAYRGRFATSDATDVHRLLETSLHAGRTSDDWPDRVEARDAARVLHQFFGSTTGPAARLAGGAARVRLLVRRLVPVPG